MGRLTGKTAVVTGASSGMGKEIVKLFAQEGANVIAVASLSEASAVILAEGVALTEDAEEAAREKNISVYSSEKSAFTLCAEIAQRMGGV